MKLVPVLCNIGITTATSTSINTTAFEVTSATRRWNCTAVKSQVEVTVASECDYIFTITVAYCGIKHFVYTTVQLPLSYSSQYFGYLSSVPRPVPANPFISATLPGRRYPVLLTTWYITGSETCTCIILHYVGYKAIRLDEGYLFTRLLICNNKSTRQRLDNIALTLTGNSFYNYCRIYIVFI